MNGRKESAGCYCWVAKPDMSNATCQAEARIALKQTLLTECVRANAATSTAPVELYRITVQVMHVQTRWRNGTCCRQHSNDKYVAG